jgi:hypothetical protein
MVSAWPGAAVSPAESPHKPFLPAYHQNNPLFHLAKKEAHFNNCQCVHSLCSLLRALRLTDEAVPLTGVVVHACNLSPGEAEARGLPVPDQPGLHSKTLSQNTKKKALSYNSKAIVAYHGIPFCLIKIPH